ncbi:MAG: hypothetical protein U1D30_25400 [Planctomycetota bacterium]
MVSEPLEETEATAAVEEAVVSEVPAGSATIVAEGAVLSPISARTQFPVLQDREGTGVVPTAVAVVRRILSVLGMTVYRPFLSTVAAEEEDVVPPLADRAELATSLAAAVEEERGSLRTVSAAPAAILEVVAALEPEQVVVSVAMADSEAEVEGVVARAEKVVSAPAAGAPLGAREVTPCIW